MARGTVVGEPVVSQAQNRAFDDGWERMEHRDDGRRGRFVWDPVQQRLVRPSERVEERAVDAPILSGRFYENTKALDGSDIGSRAKHRDYMRAHGLAPADDFSPGWYEGERKKAADQAKRERREVIERAFYEIANKR
jgi:hypothetical protein